jgi:hypothetical protein
VDPFPAEHELLGLLGVPTLTDPDIPWAYNRLAFRQSVAGRSVEVIIEPGEGHVAIRLADAESEVVSLNVKGVAGLRVENEREGEGLVVSFRTSPGAGDLRLLVRPALHVY